MITKIYYINKKFTKKPPKFKKFIRPIIYQLPTINLNTLTNFNKYQYSTTTPQ